MAAICFNQDDGDAWEHADKPRYANIFTSRACWPGIQYVFLTASR
jgi:hypothetical protein